ncbi:MAG: hypothetical protein KatS3mg088_339 [Patescibacteria group bacterium]|nr:MAG: hypothetical protein KatS3mg088_339 [Patescibacteria group bacterium]
MKNNNKILPKLPASSGAFVVHKGKILLLKRDNNPKIPNPNCWSIIGGVVEKGETFEEALIRETQEEICIKPKNYSLLGQLKMFKDKITRAIFLIILDEDEASKVRLGNEGQKLSWFTPSQIGKINAVPEIKTFFQKNGKYIDKLIKGKIEIEDLKKYIKNEIEETSSKVLLTEPQKQQLRS